MKPVYFYAQKWDSTAGGGAGAYVEWNPDPISAGGDGPVPSPTSFLISAEGVLTAQPEGPTAGNEKDGDIRVVMRLDGDTSSYTSMRIGIQRFNNPDSLEHLESGMYRFTAKTSPLNSDADGKPKPSAANSNGCGRTRQGMLELSNVDLVNEFTEMIVTQRAFQANSKTITTADEMLQTVMGLKR